MKKVELLVKYSFDFELKKPESNVIPAIPIPIVKAAI
jgi:hypothetical protein